MDHSSIRRTSTGRRSPQITTYAAWQLSGKVQLQRSKRPQRPYVAGVALWHAAGALNYGSSVALNYVV